MNVHNLVLTPSFFRQPKIIGLGVLAATFLAGATAGTSPFLALTAVGGLFALGLYWVGLTRVPALASMTLLCIAATDAVTLPLGSLTISKTAGVLVIAGWILVRLRQRDRPWPRNIILLFALLYVLWAAASLLWSYDQNVAMVRIQMLVLISIAAYITADDLVSLHHLRVFANAAWIIGAFSGLTSLYQWFLYGGGLFTTEDMWRIRATGVIGDPTEFAIFQVVKLPFVLVSLRQAEGFWGRALRVLAAGIILASIGVTQSRSGMLALVALVGSLVIVTPEIRQNRRLMVGGTIIAILIGILFFLPALDRFTSTAATNFSRERRPTLWRVATLVIQDRPLLGVGIGNFVVSDIYFSYENTLDTIRIANKSLVVHNAYLEAAAELGVFGFIIFVGLLGSALWQSLRLTTHPHRELAIYAGSLTAALCAHAVQLLFYSSQYDKGLWILFGFCIALVSIRKQIDARDDSSKVKADKGFEDFAAKGRVQGTLSLEHSQHSQKI